MAVKKKPKADQRLVDDFGEDIKPGDWYIDWSVRPPRLVKVEERGSKKREA